jgi:RimJ/RimL family protein N-acetyltransferase
MPRVRDAWGMPTPTPTLHTARLLLRAPSAADIGPLDEMDTDPEVMRYIGDGVVRPRTKEQTADMIAAINDRWRERGYGWLSVTARDSGEFLGLVILAVPEFLPQVLPAVEIGWRFQRRHWGRGYATEAARPLLHYAFTVCGLDRVVSIRYLENTASQRVMEKLGLRPVSETVVPRTGQPVAVHAITRAEYDADLAAGGGRH